MEIAQAVPTQPRIPASVLAATRPQQLPSNSLKPFIMDYFEYREGVFAGTSTGYWNDADALDAT